MKYKCNRCDNEGCKFTLCSECKDGLMIRKKDSKKPAPTGWQPYKKGDDFSWKNGRHN